VIIKKADIESFGKFSGRTIDFKPNFNLIFGSNEDGKSTLMAFFKMMFYGSSSGKSSDIAKNLRKKYAPWSGAHISGAVEFEVLGQALRLHKEFKKSSASDKVTLYDLSIGRNIPVSPATEIGEQFFDMDLGEFERSVFIETFGGFSSDASGDSLAMRIANLSVSGDESISQNTILSRIAAAKEELVSKSGKKGLLVNEETRLEKLNADMDMLTSQIESQYTLMSQIDDLKTEISRLELSLDAADKAKKSTNAEKELKTLTSLSEKIDRLNALTDDIKKWGIATAALKEQYLCAKELLDKIPNAPQNQTLDITPDDYRQLYELKTCLDGFKSDRETLALKINPAADRVTSAFRSEKKRIKRTTAIILSALSLSGLAGLTLLFLRYTAGIYPLLLAAVLLLSLLGKWRKAENKPSVTETIAGYENALRNLSFFTEDLLKKSPDEIGKILENNESDCALTLKNHLQKFDCTDFENFKAKAAESFGHAEINKTISSQKQQFAELISKIKKSSSFEDALSIFDEIKNAFSMIEETENQISVITSAIGMTEVNKELLNSQIKELNNIVKTAPPKEDSIAVNTDELKTILMQKRRILGELQSRIDLPKVSEHQLAAQIEECRQRLDAYKERYQGLLVVSEAMDMAISETNKGLGSHLSKKTGEYLRLMSGGRYGDVLVGRDLNVEARSSASGGYHEWKYLSSGAIDRVYLALRLAATDIIAQKHNPLPLFMDDILTQYDDENCKNTLKFLKEYIENSGSASQIFFFTCHNHIREMAKEIIPDINEIIL